MEAARSPEARSARRVPREAARRTAAPTAAWASRKGTPRGPGPRPGRRRRSRRPRRRAHRTGPAAAPATRPARAPSEPTRTVGGLEGGRLVLLQVAVIGQRQALDRGQEPGEAPDAPVPARPRTSSATSGLRFCGACSSPVAQASGSRKPNSATPTGPCPRPAGTRGPWRSRRRGQQLGDGVPVGGRVHGVVEARRRSRGRWRSPPGRSGSDEPAIAPAPSGLTSARRPASWKRSTSRARAKPCGGELEGPAAPAGPAGGG